MFASQLRKMMALSLATHMIFMWILDFMPTNEPISQKSEVIELSLLQEDSALPKIETDVQKKKEERPQQIVDQDEKPLNDEIDEKTRFLSRNNQVVKEQKIAKNYGLFQNKKDLVKAVKGSIEKKDITLKDLTPKFDLNGTVAVQNKFEDEKEPSTKGTASQKSAEVSQTIDYIKELDPGLETMLSTREFVYYSYYNRIRSQLAQHWEPLVREKLTQLYSRGRSIASSDDKITKVLITLDTKGKLMKVQIIGNSGLRDLDEAAVEAFQEAAPFPNPPSGMIEPDGTIKIRWDFILEA
jgi:TonB family protein